MVEGLFQRGQNECATEANETIVGALGQTIGGAAENLKEGQSLVEATMNGAKDIDGGAVAGAAVGAGAAKALWVTTTYAMPAGAITGTVSGELAVEASISAVLTGGSEYYGSKGSGDGSSDKSEYEDSGLACYGKDIEC